MIETDLLQSLFRFIFTRLPAVLRQAWRPGEQVVQKTAVSIVQMLWNFGKQVFKIIIRFQIVGFCCFCNTVYNGAGLRHPPEILSGYVESTVELILFLFLIGNIKYLMHYV